MATTWSSPDFSNPPIVETVFGAQFSALPGFTSGHYGWFWREYLGSDWPFVADAPFLVDQIERFGDQQWAAPPTALSFQLGPFTAGGPLSRLQMTNKARDRVVQIQPTRFIYNWRRQEGRPYPRYAERLSELNDLYGRFRSFAEKAGLGELRVNQWEVSYINHIPRGQLWQSPADFPRLLPGLLRQGVAPAGSVLDSIGPWQFEIPQQKGRLHVAAQHARSQSASGPEVLNLDLTARGPVAGQTKEDLKAGLDLGHEVIIRAFTEITSPEAQKAWGRK
jgi:uncharacterized protein (TIGR04255 family)